MNTAISKALVFWPFYAFGARTGAHQVQLSDLMALIGLGYQVTLFGSELFGDPDTAWNIKDIGKLEDAWGIKVHLSTPGPIDRLFHAHQRATRLEHWDMYHTPWLLDEYRTVFKDLNPDLVVIYYAWWGKFAIGDEFHSATRILRSLDVLSHNDQIIQKVLPYLKEPSFPEYVDPIITEEDFFSNLQDGQTVQSEEYRIYDAYDCTIAITPADARIIKQQTLQTTVCDVPPALSVQALSNAYDGSPIFVGSDNPLNIQGYVFFALQVLPAVLHHCPDFSLKAIGGFSKKVAHVRGVELLGYVPNLKPYYASAPFSICPMLGGTGIQIKILESMAHGVPVVAMKQIAQASPLEHGVNGFIANNAEEFSRYVIQLSTDRSLCRKLGEAARDTIAGQFSLNRIVKKWREAIESAQCNREKTTTLLLPAIMESRSCKEEKQPMTSSDKIDITHPKISIVTPTKNCAHYLRECIESVLAQNYENFEHIIVDGASHDGTVEILKSYPHVKWISEPDNGEAEALNKALGMAEGDIISWLNADDHYVGTDVLRLVARAMSETEGRHLVYGKTLLTDERKTISWLQIPRVPITLPVLMRWWDLHELYQPSIFYSKALIDDIGKYREDLYFSIDYEYWLRIAAKGYSFHYVDQVLSQSRLFRQSGKSAQPRKEQEESWTQTAAAFQDHLSEVERIHFWKDYYRYQLPYLKQSDEPITPPNDEWAQIGLALVLRGCGVGSEVVKLLENTITLAPENADAHWLLGDEFLRGMKDIDRATPVLDKAQSLSFNLQKIATKRDFDIGRKTYGMSCGNGSEEVTHSVTSSRPHTISQENRYVDQGNRPLRVLFQNRPNAMSQPGGDTLLMNNFKRGLERAGVHVDVALGQAQSHDYDLVHVFNFATPEFTEQCARDAVQAGVPFVATALFEDWPRFLSKSSATIDVFRQYFASGFDEQQFSTALKQLHGLSSSPPSGNAFVAQHAGCVFASGEAERRRLLEVYPQLRRVEIVKMGMDHLSTQGGSSLFCDQYNVTDYVLCVGRLETRKNQLMLLKALQYESLPIVFVTGGVSYQPEYEDLCRRFPRTAPTIFVGRLSDEMLASCYQGAKVFCLPSWYELPGIVTVEAARFGCAIVATSWGTLKDYLPYGVHYCEPDDPNSIRDAILDAFRIPPPAILQTDAAQFCWDKTANRLKSLYLEVLAQARKTSSQSRGRSSEGSDSPHSVRSELSLELQKVQVAITRGRLDEAQDSLEKIIRHNPTESDAWLSSGVLSMQRQDYRSAVDAFMRALKYGGNDRKCRMGLVMAWMGAEEAPKASNEALEILKAYPDDEEAIHWLIRACTALEDWKTLETALSYYLQRNPANCSVRFALASVYVRLGEKEAAKTHINTLKLLSPNFDGMDELERLMNARPNSSTHFQHNVGTHHMTAVETKGTYGRNLGESNVLQDLEIGRPV
ncbi:MAG: glycosyltransferase [Nitrospirales bacterium]|nr:glycosyltransferase [Nitrospira sp.]MDR4502364.1 glycosyltransferase [Nitrospirales bacterium]